MNNNTVPTINDMFHLLEVEECKACFGSGYIGENACQSCEGTGKQEIQSIDNTAVLLEDTHAPEGVDYTFTA